MLRFRGLTGLEQRVREQLGSGAGGRDPAAVERTIAHAVAYIEAALVRHGLPPKALSGPARRAYAWLRFLSVPGNLERHLDATQRAAAVAQGLCADAPSAVAVEFGHMAALWRRTQSNGVWRVQMTEGLIAADDAVLEAVLRAALIGGSTPQRRAYLEFTETDAYRDVLLELDLAADVDADEPTGAAYDLRELFAAVNAAHFGGAMTLPRLAWSDRLASRRLGYFEPQRDRIVVNRALDAARTPRFVVEYVVYHELLHRKLGASWSGSRMRSHTAEFRREERKFARWREAEEWLRTEGARAGGPVRLRAQRTNSGSAQPIDRAGRRPVRWPHRVAGEMSRRAGVTAPKRRDSWRTTVRSFWPTI